MVSYPKYHSSKLVQNTISLLIQEEQKLQNQKALAFAEEAHQEWNRRINLEEKKVIYIITSGSYSDYSIRAVCSTRKQAEYTISTCFTQDNASIKEWEIDPLVILPPPGYQYFYVTILKNGDIIRILTDNDTTGRLSNLSLYFDFWRNDEGWLTSEILARSKEHAIKIANEQRLAIIAADLWKIGTSEEDLASLFGKQPTGE